MSARRGTRSIVGRTRSDRMPANANAGEHTMRPNARLPGYRIAAAIVSLAAIAALQISAAAAQSPADFYRGKSIELDIGYSAGGGYDLYARLLARHLGEHIPGNPTIVPKNMEGA